MVAGEAGDPVITLRLQLFEAWRGAWNRFNVQEKRLVSLAWRAALPVVAVAAPSGRWKTVQGTMTATIATVLDMGWAPATPPKWLSQQRDAHADVEADDA